MEQYLREELARLAAPPSHETWLADVRRRKRAAGSRLPAELILAHRDVDRR